MANGNEYEPIGDEEILYRRVHPDHYPQRVLDKQAFRPGVHDTMGLSLFRAKFQTALEVAHRGRGPAYYVAHLVAGKLRARGMTLRPAPQEGNPGHCEIAELTYANRREDYAEELQLALAEELCERIEGPFRK